MIGRMALHGDLGSLSLLVLPTKDKSHPQRPIAKANDHRLWIVIQPGSKLVCLNDGPRIGKVGEQFLQRAGDAPKPKGWRRMLARWSTTQERRTDLRSLLAIHLASVPAAGMPVKLLRAGRSADRVSHAR